MQDFADIFGKPSHAPRAGREERYEIRPETRHHSVATSARPLARSNLIKYSRAELNRGPLQRSLLGRGSVMSTRPMNAFMSVTSRKHDRPMDRSLLRRFTQNQGSQGASAMRETSYMYRARQAMNSEQRNVGAPVDHARSQTRKQADFSFQRLRMPAMQISQRGLPHYRAKNAQAANRLAGVAVMKDTQRGGEDSLEAFTKVRHFAPRQTVFKGARPERFFK